MTSVSGSNCPNPLGGQARGVHVTASEEVRITAVFAWVPPTATNAVPACTIPDNRIAAFWYRVTQVTPSVDVRIVPASPTVTQVVSVRITSANAAVVGAVARFQTTPSIEPKI